MRTGEDQPTNGRPRLRGFVACLGIATGLILLAPAASPAAVTCDQTGAVVAITLSASGDLANVRRDLIVPNNINVNDVQCEGTATVLNTDTITITDTSGGATTVFIQMFNGAFAPGVVNETGMSDEIEFRVDLGTGGVDTLVVDGSSGDDFIRAGADGINLNAGEADGVDADINDPGGTTFPAGVEGLSVSGLAGNDTIRGDGGVGTGAAVTVPQALFGNSGTDFLLGGGGNDSLRGDENNDTLNGGAAGSDTVAYDGADGPISVNLGLAGPQVIGADQGTDTIDGATIEVLRGSNGFGDSLTGKAGPDTIDALGGDDAVFDRDGAADVIDCGDDMDTVTTDAAGVDMLTACETQLFPALPITPITPSTPATAPNPACAALRAKLKKTKSKKRKRSIRGKLKKLGC